MTQFTYYRWRKEFGGLKGNQVKRLKYLEKENERLRKAVSDLTLEKLVLKEEGADLVFRRRAPATDGLCPDVGKLDQCPEGQGRQEGEINVDFYGFHTCPPNAEVGAVHPKAMPVALTSQAEIDAWMTALAGYAGAAATFARRFADHRRAL